MPACYHGAVMQEQRLAFGPFVFDPASASLWRGETLLILGGRAVALLAALLEARNAVVTKADLMERGWPGLSVEEGNLAVQIATLRKVLGTRPDGGEWIATVARVGYRLVRESSDAREAGRPGIAVLPFLNFSNDPDQDYFADGLVEDLITGLSRFKTFAVIARNSAFVYKGRAVDMREVSRELGVRYLLEGSVRRADERIRVSAQLIDGASGSHIWAENFDGRFSDLFDVQDRITGAAVRLIEPQIRQAEVERLRRKRPESLDAYDLYLQAAHHFYGQGVVRSENYDRAIGLFEQAIALDSQHAPALALCAWAHEKRRNRHRTRMPSVDDAAEAIKLSERAVKADPTDPMSVLVAGVVAMTIKGDRDTGYRLIQQAAALNPNSAVIASTAAYTSFHRGDFDGSVAMHERAIAACPGAPSNFWSMEGLARAHLSAGRIEEALTWAMRSRDHAIASNAVRAVEVAAYALLGREDAAKATVDELLSEWPGSTIETLLDGDPASRRHERLLAEGLKRAGLPAA
jgi:TolB-like protein/Flp pilus assembly protein TadD